MLKNNETHFVGQINQKALIQKEGKVLLVKYPDYSDKHPIKARGKWDMPGGRLNVGEKTLAGLKREVFEEIGTKISVQKILTVGTFVNLGGQPNFFIIYECSLENDNVAFKI